jgi:hypothetical protein
MVVLEHLQHCSVCDPYVILQKIILTSKSSYLLFSNPTHKLKLKSGTANRWETINSKPPGPIIMIGQSETGSNIRSYLSHSSLAGVRLCCAFHYPQQTVQKCWVNTILLSQPACFNFYSSNFNLQGHLPSPVELLLV